MGAGRKFTEDVGDDEGDVWEEVAVVARETGPPGSDVCAECECEEGVEGDVESASQF